MATGTPVVPTATLGRELDPTVPKAQVATELGASGLKGARPMEGWLYEEFLPQLRGLQAARTYRQMADNDPIIGAALFTFQMLLRAVPWSVVAADETPAAQQAKEWVESVFFQDMQIPFGSVISDICSMLQYGFAPAEVTYKLRRGPNKDVRFDSQFNDGTMGIRKIAVRAQDTVWRWHFSETGDLLGMDQFLSGRGVQTIPGEKLLNFCTTYTLGNPEGRSILRNCYLPWSRKNTVEEAEGRAAIRSAGLVVVRIPGKFLDPNASGDELAVANSYKALADKVAKDSMGAVVFPSDADQNTKVPLYDIDYKTTEASRPVDMSGIVERYDKRMLSSMLADFILLGQQAVGSFALSDNKTAMFSKACGAFLSVKEDQFNRVQLTRLWKLNAFDPATKPRLKPGDLEAVDLDKLGMFILRLAQSGAQLFPDPKLEAEVKAMANLPVYMEQG